MEEQRKPTPKVRKGLHREGRRTGRRRRELRELQGSEAKQLDQEGNWSSGERFMVEKVHELFQECGGAERGFITRDDMQKLQNKFSFSPEELEVVFDKLDVDRNGCLTPEKLTRGLSHFLTDQSQEEDNPSSQNVSEFCYQSQSLQQEVEVEDEEKQHFAALMERLGANTTLEDKSEIWKLWVQLRRNEPNLLGNLEDFVSKVTVQLQEAQSEKKDLERTLKKRMMEHNAEVQRLYEEMELQINNEKERIESENIVRLHAQSQDLQKEIDSKQEEVQHLVQTRTQLQAELVSLHSKQDDTITENEKLKLTNQELETQLEQIQQELQEAQDRLVGQQEEAARREEKETQREEKEAQREEKEGERDQSPSNEGLRSDEADPQKEARQRWGSDTSQGDVRSEGLRRNHRNLGHQSRIISIEEEPLLQQALQHSEVQSSRVIGQEIDLGTVKDGDAVFEEKADPSWNDKAADPTEELQAELVSLRSKQDEAITEIERLKLTNQELEMQLEQIQQEFQEAQDRLVGQQEEAAQREEKEGEQDQSPGSEGRRSDEADPQLQAELVSLRSKQDEAITEIERLKLTNQELEMQLQQIQQEFQEAQDRLVGQQEEAAQREEKEGLQRTRSIRRRVTRNASSKPDPLGEDSGLPHLRVEGQEVTVGTGGDGACEETATTSARDEAAERVKELQAELVSLRSKQDETITENHKLKLTNQELEVRLEQIQQEFQEAQDRLVGQQEEAAQREEKEREWDQSPGSEERRSDEADPQLQAELVSLRSKQDEAITEIERVKLTNQELEVRLEQIQQELHEAQDRLVGQQEEAAQREEKEAQREEKEGERDQSPGSEGRRSDEADPQLQAELVSLRSKQDEAITEIERLKLTNQELEMRLEQIQQEFQEAQDRLVGQQEEAAQREEKEAQREEKEGERDQSPGSEGRRSDEADPQLQAELVSLRSKQDEAITEIERLKLTNQELEMRLEQIQQEFQEAQDRLVGQQEEAALREEKEGERDQSPGSEGRRSDEADPQLQAELVSLRSNQDEAITEIERLKLTNQELEMRLEQIQQELQEAQDRLVGQQEEAAQREEKEGEWDQSPGSEGRRSDEADPQLQAELVSLRSKQDEAITEIERLKLTNQELEMRLEQIQQELQEAQDRLVGQQEEAAQREEKEGERDQSPGSEGRRSDEADPQLQAELVSLRSNQDEAITEIERLKLTNQELEMRLEQIQQEFQEAQDRLVGQQEEAAQREEKEGLQRTRSIRRRVTRNASSKPDPLGEDSGLPHLRVEGQEVTVGTGGDGDGACEETTTTSARDEAAERVKELQAELVSLRSKQDETITENHKLKLTNQELEMRLEQIQQEFQEAQDRLVGQQEEAAQREEKERERDQSPGSEGRRSDEADPQLQAELVSLRSKQDEAITEIERLKLTNQELEMRLEQIQQEFQEAQDRLVGQQEEATQREEKDGEQDQSPGSEGRRSDEADPQLQAELVSLRSKQDEAITEIERLKLTNQELEMRLEQIQQEFQEAQDRLVGQQEEAAQREEKEGERDQSPGTEGRRSDEADPQLQAELVSLRSNQDEAITEIERLKLTNQELEMRLEQIQQEFQEAQDRLVGQQEEAAQREEKEGLQRTRSIRRRVTRNASSKPDPLGEDSGLPHLRVEGQEVAVGTGGDGDGACELQAELVSLRSKQDETITENHKLKLTNQELEMRLVQIQQEFQEAQDRLVGQQEEAAQREEKERERDQSPGSEGRRSDEADPQLQAELVSLRNKQDEAIIEIERLKLTNQELEMRLEQIQQEFQEAQDQLVGQQEEAAQREEKEGLQRTRSIRRRVTRNASSKPDPLGEDSGLPHLRVEGQEVTVGTGGDGDGACEETTTTSARDETAERVKELQAELVSLRSKQDETITENHKLKLTNQELEVRLEQIQQELQEAQDRLVGQQEEAAQREEKEGLQRTRSIRRRATHNTSNKPDPLGEDSGLPHLRVEGQEVTVGTGGDGDGACEETATTSARDKAAERIKEVANTKDPDHLYNIIFVGNANAGKTSFIQRFSDDNFHLGLSATVGIDFRVKSLTVENRHIALQLWDTAGQERFRSVTKQFFRKADGVIVMYDITASSSFSEVRYWLSCVKEFAADDVVILLLGNKMDDAVHRQVPTVEGERLAQEYSILFYECSACTGHNISPPMVHLAKLLKQQEETIKKTVVEIVKQPAKKGKCCM